MTASNVASDSGVGGGVNGNPVLTNAMFSSLLQGVMQEVAGVVSGHQSPNTVAHFLRNIPDFTYTAGESFLFDLFMTMVISSFDFFSLELDLIYDHSFRWVYLRPIT